MLFFIDMFEHFHYLELLTFMLYSNLVELVERPCLALRRCQMVLEQPLVAVAFLVIFLVHQSVSRLQLAMDLSTTHIKVHSS